MRKLFIIGDPHGYFESLRYTAMNHTNSDFVCVGDINVGYPKKNKDLYERYEQFEGWNEELKEAGNIMYWVRGNHDNPNFWFENKFNYSNIILVQDYTVLNLKKNILCVGGAISIDRIFRTEGISYWKNEEFVYDEEKTMLIENVDIVVTHSAPDFAFPRGIKGSTMIEANSYKDKTLKDDLIVERLDISKMFSVLTYSDKNNITEWYYGHFHKSHIDYIEDVKFQLLDELEVFEA